MIWDYQYSIAEDILKSYEYFEINNCPFCKAKLFQLSVDRYYGGSYLGAGLSGDYGDQGKQLQVCQTCGWWVISRKKGYAYGSYEGSLSIQRGCGCLKNLDKVDINEIPINELRKYLIAKYDSNKLMNGRRFEEVVFSIFKDFKYDVVLTEYSGDKGIDLINSEKLYKLLKLSQRNIFESPEDYEAGFYKYWKDLSLLPVVYSHSW